METIALIVASIAVMSMFIYMAKEFSIDNNSRY